MHPASRYGLLFIFIFVSLALLSGAQQSLNEIASITHVANVTSMAMNTNSGRFYILGDDLQEFNSTNGALLRSLPMITNPIWSIPFSNLTYGYPQTRQTAGQITILNSGNSSFLFVCQGQSVGIIDLTNPSSPFTISNYVWNISSASYLDSTYSVTQCSLYSDGSLWVMATTLNSYPLNVALFRLSPTSNDFTSPWQSQSSQWIIPALSKYFLNVGPMTDVDWITQVQYYAPATVSFALSQSGVAIFYCTKASSVARLPLYPINSQLSTPTMVTILPQFGTPGLDSYTGDFWFFANQLLYDLSGSANGAIPRIGGLPSSSGSILLDGSPTKRQIWALQVPNIQRYPADTTFTTAYTWQSVVTSFLATTSASTTYFPAPAMDVTSNTQIWSICSNSTEFSSFCNISVVPITDCSRFASCNDCSGDFQYCSWCVTPTGSTCTAPSQCSGGPALQTCPVLSVVNPSASAYDASFTLTITGSNFLLINATVPAGNLTCYLDGAISPLTVLSDSLATCPFPSGTSIGTNVPFQLAYQTHPLDAYHMYDMTVYNCSQFQTCFTCASAMNSQCGWCISDGVCGSGLNPEGACPTINSPFLLYGSASQYQCGQISSISPPSTPVEFASIAQAPQYALVYANFPNITSGNWYCSFNLPTTTVTILGTLISNSGYLNCSIPPLPASQYSVTRHYSAIANVSIYLETSSSYSLFTAQSFPFEYYACNESSTCASCTTSIQPYCQWCLSSASCSNNATTTCSSNSATTTCPSITATPPSSTGSVSIPLTINGGPFTQSNNYNCLFVFANGTTLAEIAATWQSTSQLNCSAPAISGPITAPFDVQLSILILSSPYTSSIKFRYYTCNPSPSDCQLCADPLHTACAWCTASAACISSSSISSCPSALQGTCPSVTSVNPTTGAWQGHLGVSLEGSSFSKPSTSMACSFVYSSNSNQNFSSNATISSDTAASCSTPVLPTPGDIGDYLVTLNYDVGNTTVTLQSNATFTYTDCTQIVNCGSCMQATQCAWCPASAACMLNTQNCSVGPTVLSSSSCPVLTSVSPTEIPIATAAVITVQGQNLYYPAFDSKLYCIVESGILVPATRASPIGASTDVYTCNIPSTFSIQTGTAFALYLKNPILVPYAATPTPTLLNLFQCLYPFVTPTCPACSSPLYPGCGWCASDSTCTSSGYCSDPTSWSQSVCPRVNSVNPPYTDDSLSNMTASLSVGGLKLAENLTLACTFGNLTSSVPATIDLSTSTVQCQIPLEVGITSRVDVQLTMWDHPAVPFTFNPNNAPFSVANAFEFVNCHTPSYPVDTCATCAQASQDERCGWCVYSGRCGLEKDCALGLTLPIFHPANVSMCPTISDISPTSGSAGGNTLITISGSGFIQDSRLQCLFEVSGADFNLAPTVFVSSSQVTCTSPAQSSSSQSSSASFSLVLLNSAGAKRDELKLEASSSHDQSTQNDEPRNSRKALERKAFDDDILRSIAKSRETQARRRASLGGWTVFASSPVSFTFNAVNPPSKPQNLAWIAAPVIIGVIIIIIVIVLTLYLRKRKHDRALVPPDFTKYAFSANTRLMREVAAAQKPLLDSIVPFLSEANFILPVALREMSSSSNDELISKSLIYASYRNLFALELLTQMIRTEVQFSQRESELFRANSLACKMFTVYSKVIGIQYLWRTLARSIHTLDEAGVSEDNKKANPEGKSGGPPSSGHVSMMDLGSLEVDPERLAEKLEKEVDDSVMADITIYQYELLLKTGHIFKKIVDTVNQVPMELRLISKRVKLAVHGKYAEHGMDLKGVGAFIFLRFFCPAVMTPQIYGVLEHVPGETSQRYFVLISKTLQNLANGTLPSQKENYMAKMDEFVLENKEKFSRYIQHLIDIEDQDEENADHPKADVDEEEGDHHRNAASSPDERIEVADDLYYSSLSFIHTLYIEHSADIQKLLKSHGADSKFIQRLDNAMHNVSGDKKSKKGKKKDVEQEEPLIS